MDSEKHQISIYKINQEARLFENSDDPLTTLGDHMQAKGYSPQALVNGTGQNYTVRIFYKKNPFDPKWKGFLRPVVQDNQAIVSENQSYAESFVMLVYNSDSQNLYATTGGFGFHVVQDYIDDDFGVDILSRLIKKDDRILKSVKEKSVMGGILGTTKFFRKNYNFFENDSFGKIYQELKAQLDKDVLTSRFGFSEEDLQNDATCIAKSSFKINRSISYEQLFEIVSGCEYVLSNLQPITINNVEKIIKKRNPTLTQALEDCLFNQLWERFSDTPEAYDFDLCHKDFEQYLTAAKYIIRKGQSENNLLEDFVFSEPLDNIDKLFEKLKTSDIAIDDKDQFVKLMRSIKIYSYGEENNTNELTKGLLLQHLFGDVTHNDIKYFLIDNNWYKIKEEFLAELNESCASFIKENLDDGMEKTWNHPTLNENGYNQSYIDEENTLVLDKITPDNIEACDILQWDDSNLYLYHVKAGFGNTMRDLCSQVFIASNNVRSSMATAEKKYIGKLYDQLANKIGSNDNYFARAGQQTQNISRENFIRLFDKKLIFVLAILDTATNERNITTHITEFDSNIAKFSLQELVKGMRGVGASLRISQIKKPSVS